MFGLAWGKGMKKPSLKDLPCGDISEEYPSLYNCRELLKFPPQNVVIPGFFCLRESFHPPNLAIAHLYHLRLDGTYGFLVFRFLPQIVQFEIQDILFLLLKTTSVL